MWSNLEAFLMLSCYHGGIWKRGRPKLIINDSVEPVYGQKTESTFSLMELANEGVLCVTAGESCESTGAPIELVLESG
jgi:hypothetical protein